MIEGPLGSALEFLRLLWAVDHSLQTASRRMARRVGVSGPQRVVLRIVGRRPGISPAGLASLLHLHRSSVTPLIQKLETRGFLRRAPHPSDGRRVLLSLTPRGRRIDRLSTGTVEAAVRRTLARTPAARVAAAESLLASLEEALSAPGMKRPRAPRRRDGR
jgi:MarR family transcriptional regulator, organic hydroperoxide resistance regulator